MLGRPVIRPEFPQLAGAMGAAIYAINEKGEAGITDPNHPNSEGELQ